MMLAGLGFMPTVFPGDQCVDARYYTKVPCATDPSSAADLLCWDGSYYGKCSDLPGGKPLPIYSLPEVLSMAPSQGQQVVSATVNVPGCDPMIMASGFLCSSNGPVVNYTRGQYAVQQYDPPQTAQNIGLNPTQVQQLTNAGLIQPTTSPNQVINPTWYDPWASTPGYYLPYQPPIPTTTPIYTQPTTSPTPAATTPTPAYTPTPTPTPTVTPQQQVQPQSYPTGGTIPGANTAQQYQTASTPAPTTGSDQILPGLDNKTLYIGAGALVLLLLLKK